MLDKLLRVLAIADPVTPLRALGTGGTAIRISRQQAPSGREIEGRLRRAGVKVKHVMVDPIRNEVRIAVVDRDAQKARRVLAEEGLTWR